MDRGSRLAPPEASTSRPDQTHVNFDRFRRIAPCMLPPAALVLLFMAACGGGGGDGRSAEAAGAAPRNAAEAPIQDIVIPASATKYSAVTVASPGTVTGTITAAADLAPAAPSPVGADSSVCGASIPDSSVQRSGAGLGNVVVWLDGVRSGAALPIERRLELESDHCILTPRVQAAVTGSAVNVIGHDEFRQHLTFMSGGEKDPRVRVLLGKYEQVIPTELPAKVPGLVVVRDTDHPWVRSYVAVFDHPYFAITKPDGSFSIPNVPPGTYTVKAWHERTAVAEQKVTVGAGAVGTVRVELKGK